MADVAVIQRFLPGASPGGVGHFTDGLSRALVRRGHRVTIFSQDPAPEGAPYSVRRVPVSGRLAPLTFPFAVRRCDVSGFHVVLAQGDDQWMPRRGRPPFVRTLHGTALAEAWFNGVRGRSVKHGLLHLWFYVNEWIAAWRADALVVVSAHTRRFYRGPATVIPNGVDIGALAPDGRPKSPHPTVLFIGAVHSRKRGDLLIRAMRDVRRTLSDAELWIAGDASAPEEPGCRWLGRVDDATLRERLRRAWVMCLPSAYEGFGRPYVEAMAAGTTVVATRNPGAVEVLGDGAFGVITEPDALAQTLVGILQDAATRARLEAAALIEARRYDWDVVAQAYEQAWRKVAPGA